MKRITLFFAFTFVFSCDINSKYDETIYRSLDKELDEISGLTSDANKLFAINDEKGIIYELDQENFNIKGKIKFKKKGDYEGITVVSGVFYVLKSNGDILHVSKNGEIIKKYKIPKRFDGFEFEGICYEKSSNQLLLLCKKHPKKKRNKFISIYSFSLHDLDYKENEFITIQKNETLKHFAPTGLEIKNDVLFILSSKAPKLISFNFNTYKLEVIKSFNSLALPQLEGLTLLNNKFYVASEKNKKKNATIYSFTLE
ncbi:MAG: SdiA-regulated domain-containing protein [Vicingaceae bacterium]